MNFGNRDQRGLPLLTEEELVDLERIGHVIKRRAGHIFISQGEETDFALLIRTGHVKVLAGAPPRVIAIRGAGEVVGEMAAIRRHPRSASIVAVDEVEALHLSGREWLQFLYDHPRAMHAQLVAVDERLDQATRKIVESDLAMEQRLAKALVELVESGLGSRDGDDVVLQFGQQDLATLTGASLDSIKKIIRTFKEGQLVGTRRQSLVIHDLAAMARVADGDRVALP